MKRAKTPTVLQMEATECGAASLGMILAHHGLYVPLEKLREECGVSRDGSKASSILRAAKRYGMVAKGFSKNPESIRALPLPLIVHWNFNHFLVVEGFSRKRVYLNDPAGGRRTVSHEEFSQAFTGVVLTFEPSKEFVKGGQAPSIIAGMKRRSEGVGGAILFLLFCSLALVFPGLVMPTLVRVFIDDVLIQRKDEWLKPLLFGIAASAVLRAALIWLKQKYLLRLYMRLAVVGSAKFIWHVLKLPIPFFLARYAGEIGDRIRLNDRVAMLVASRLAEAGLDLLMVAFYGVLLFTYDVKLSIIGVGIAALNLVALRALSDQRGDESRRLQQDEGKLVGVSMGGLQSIETFKAGGTEADFFTKWSGYWAKVHNSAQALALSTMYLAAVPALLGSLNAAVIIVLGGREVMSGNMTIGELIAFQMLMAAFLAPVDGVVAIGSLLQEAEADVRRLDDVLEQEPATSLKKSGLSMKSDGPISKLTGWLELAGVTFGYVKHSPPLVTKLDIKVRPGARVALVGGSGSGKSTVARLVAGLYEPWDGSILLDGHLRRQIPEEIVNNSIAMVDQDISLFEGTIRENLTLWDPSIRDADIIQAAKDAHVHDEIAARPGGYDGKVEEAGRNFSGGQRQRLEIARALVRNPTVLLLDEATSALDPKTEQLIDQSLRRRGCTCVIVAHRLSTIRDADEILVLDNGTVVERGTHESLMEAKGRYAQLMGAA